MEGVVNMSASDNLSKAQWHQLDMFKPAKELYNFELNDVEVEKYMLRHHHDIEPDDHDIDVRGDVMGRKLEESKKSGLYNNIKRNGVLDPVNIGEGHWGVWKPGVVSDGHHRIASAFDIDPNMLVPVKHQD